MRDHREVRAVGDQSGEIREQVVHGIYANTCSANRVVSKALLPDVRQPQCARACGRGLCCYTSSQRKSAHRATCIEVERDVLT